MRKENIFTGNDTVKELYSKFRLSQGPLFHYTSMGAINFMKNSSLLWITRSDSFLDESKIRFGLGIIRHASDGILKPSERKVIETFLSGIWEILKQSYIFSLTNNASNQYLLENYGNSIVQFKEGLPREILGTGWHSIPHGDSYSLHYFIDLYELVEGYVVYDETEQLEIAKIAVKAIIELSNPLTNIVDIYHIRRLLITFITLFKDCLYREEEEYRVTIVRKYDKTGDDYNESRDIRGKNIYYIKSFIPNFEEYSIDDVKTIKKKVSDSPI